MTVTWKPEWTELSERLVEKGLFRSTDEAAEAAFDLLKEQEQKHDWLKAKVQEAIDEDVWLTPEEVDAELEAHFAELEKNLVR